MRVQAGIMKSVADSEAKAAVRHGGGLSRKLIRRDILRAQRELELEHLAEADEGYDQVILAIMVEILDELREELDAEILEMGDARKVSGDLDGEE